MFSTFTYPAGAKEDFDTQTSFLSENFLPSLKSFRKEKTYPLWFEEVMFKGTVTFKSSSLIGVKASWHMNSNCVELHNEKSFSVFNTVSQFVNLNFQQLFLKFNKFNSSLHVCPVCVSFKDDTYFLLKLIHSFFLTKEAEDLLPDLDPFFVNNYLNNVYFKPVGVFENHLLNLKKLLTVNATKVNLLLITNEVSLFDEKLDSFYDLMKTKELKARVDKFCSGNVPGAVLLDTFNKHLVFNVTFNGSFPESLLVNYFLNPDRFSRSNLNNFQLTSKLPVELIFRIIMVYCTGRTDNTFHISAPVSVYAIISKLIVDLMYVDNVNLITLTHTNKDGKEKNSFIHSKAFKLVNSF